MNTRASGCASLQASLPGKGAARLQEGSRRGPLCHDEAAPGGDSSEPGIPIAEATHGCLPRPAFSLPFHSSMENVLTPGPPLPSLSTCRMHSSGLRGGQETQTVFLLRTASFCNLPKVGASLGCTLAPCPYRLAGPVRASSGGCCAILELGDILPVALPCSPGQAWHDRVRGAQDCAARSGARTPGPRVCFIINNVFTFRWLLSQINLMMYGS